MPNQSGFQSKPVNQGKSSVTPPSAQNNKVGGMGASKKVDPMHRKPRMSPKGPGVSTKG